MFFSRFGKSSFTFLGASIFSVALLDKQLATRADQIALSHDANFAERLSEVDLSISGPRLQGCEVRYEFYIYAYQTCFMIPWSLPLSSDVGSEKQMRFDFLYFKPQPWFSPFRFSSDYYFSTSELGVKLKTIDAAFVVEKHQSGE